jgi:hypothetical protein
MRRIDGLSIDDDGLTDDVCLLLAEVQRFCNASRSSLWWPGRSGRSTPRNWLESNSTRRRNSAC